MNRSGKICARMTRSLELQIFTGNMLRYKKKTLQKNRLVRDRYFTRTDLQLDLSPEESNPQYPSDIRIDYFTLILSYANFLHLIRFEVNFLSRI